MAIDKISDRAEEAAAQPAGGRSPAPPSSALPSTTPRRRRSDRVQSEAQVVIATGLVLAICYVAKLVLVVLLVSILVAFMLAPIVEWLERARVPRSVGAFIAIVLVLAALWGFTYFFYNRAISFVNDLPRYTEKVKETIGKVRKQAQQIQRSTHEVLPGDKEERSIAVRSDNNWADLFTANFGRVWEVVLTVSFIPFLVYFMLTWQEHARAATVMLFRMENRNTAYVTLGRISSMIRGFLVGNLAIGIFLSLVSMVVFASVRLPYFYFLGIISGFLSLIPYLGVVLAMLPPLAAGVGQLHGGGALAIVLSVLGLHLFAINVLYPKLIGRRLQLNPLVVTISLLVWGWIWGAAGLILAVPITGALKIIFDHIESLHAYGAWLGE